VKLIFDIGMYDGSDTRYYLSEGYKVVAVAANPNLIEKASKEFEEQIKSGQLVLVNNAINHNAGEELSLTIAGDDLGSSSIFEEKISHKNPLGSFKVMSITINDLIEEYGQPYFVKIDIEGADRFCILPLDKKSRPHYISFEAGEDMEELFDHLKMIGYTKFKAINQWNFDELDKQESLIHRIKRKIIRLLGYKNAAEVRRSGRLFTKGHSAGPAPWVSDGKWQDADFLLKKFKSVESKNELNGWYDIHAA